MVVLSLFDGMSCGQIALKQLGVVPEMYYASEIDKHAIKQTQLNFPNTVQLGNVEQWKKWNIDWGNIDLLIAGSPCQGFSFAGKQLAFNDSRSKLFFAFIDILNHIRKYNPDVMFLLENVNMKRKFMSIISEFCGVFPVNINSSLVSAQNRDRWYWTNIKIKKVGLFNELYSDIPQPEDKHIFIRDILEENVNEKYYVSQSVINRMYRKQYSMPSINPEKCGALNTKNNSGQMSLDSGTTFISVDAKAPAQRCSKGRSMDKKHNYQFICLAMRGRQACLTNKRTEYGKTIRKDYELGKIKEVRKNIQQLEPRSDGKTNCLTSVQKDNLILQRSRGKNKGALLSEKVPTLSASSWEQNNLVIPGTIRTFKNGKGFREIKSGKAGCIPARARNDGSGQNACIIKDRIRRLTPTECSRLQTVPSWYKWECSDTQIYKMLGNGWTVDVIIHIFKIMLKQISNNIA